MRQILKNDAKKIAKGAKSFLRFLILFFIMLVVKQLILNLLPSDSPNVEEKGGVVEEKGGVIETEDPASHSTFILQRETNPT